MSFASVSSPSSDINVTPLIDVLLALLIIFMVMVPVVPRGLESSIPLAAAPAATLVPVQVRLTAGDSIDPVHYRIGMRDVAFADVQPSLRALFAMRQDRTLYVAADRSLSFRQVAEVVGAGHRAGAGAIVLSAPENAKAP
jgi:biopolymer transport protein ExbD